MRIDKRNARTIAIHAGVWLLHILINNVLLFYNEESAVFFRRTLFTYPLVAALFYINAHGIADRFLPQRRYGQAILWTVLLVGTYALIRYALFAYIFPTLNIPSMYQNFKFMFNQFTLDSLWIASQYLLFSYGYWFAKFRIQTEREKRRLISSLAGLEKERLQIEIAFLQAQINPHFLYNTFNFLYSEAFFVSPKLADAILSLSTLMRSLTETGQQSFLPMTKVLEPIQNYLKLQRYRFGDSLPFLLTIEGEEYMDYAYAPPLVFITLIENIFKHGDLSDPEQPVRVLFQLTEKILTYRSENKKRGYIDHPSTGIGMANVQKQLHLLYADKFLLNKSETQDVYRVELTILDVSITA